MKLLARLHDLVQASAHRTVDLAEDPETMLKHAVRKLDAKIRHAQAAVVAAVSSEKQIAGQLGQHRNRSEDLAAKARTAVKAGHEDLARELLGHKVDNDQLIAELESAWHGARQASTELKAQLDTLIARRAEVQRQQVSLTARQRAAQARTRLGYSLASTGFDPDSGTEVDTDIELGRLRERVLGNGGRIDGRT